MTSVAGQGVEARHQRESPSADLEHDRETTEPLAIGPSRNTQNVATQSVITDQKHPATPGSLLNMQNLRFHPRPTESDSQGEVQKPVLTNSLSDSHTPQTLRTTDKGSGTLRHVFKSLYEHGIYIGKPI